METKKKNNSPILILVLLVLLLLAIPLLQVLGMARNPKNPLWKDHYILLVKDEGKLEQFEKALKNNGYEDILHKKNAEVEYFSFRGMQRISLDEVQTRFEPEDPRLDWYMQHLPNLFLAKMNGENWNVIFVHKNASAIQFYLDLRSITKQERFGENQGDNKLWLFPEFYFFFPWAQGIFFFLITLSLYLLLGFVRFTYFVKERTFKRIYMLLGGFSWSIAAVTMDFRILPASVILFFLWISLHDTFIQFLKHSFNDRRNNEVRRGLIKKSFLLIAAIVFSSALVIGVKAEETKTLTNTFFFPLLFSFGITAFMGARVMYTSLKQEHRLFFPIRIRSGKTENWIVSLKHLLPIGMLLLYLYVGWFFHVHFFSDYSVRVPRPSSNAEIIIGDPWTVLYQSDKSNKGRTIPNISDYIKHRMIQEGFPYGYTPVELSENIPPVYESQYRKAGSQIRRKNSKIINFDEDWLHLSLNHSSLPSPMRDAGISSSISLESPYSDMLQFRNSGILYLLPIIVLFPLIPTREMLLSRKRKFRYVSQVLRRGPSPIRPSLAKLTVFFIHWLLVEMKMFKDT